MRNGSLQTAPLKFTDRRGPVSRTLQLLFANVHKYLPQRCDSAVYWFESHLRGYLAGSSGV